MDSVTERHVVDYTDARNMMVDGQVRPNKVYDPRVLRAMRTLPRERFVPSDRATLAYTDGDVRLPGGRVLMQPMSIARLVQIAAAREGDRAMVVGAGAGYGAALLAACGASVVAVEEDQTLLGLARSVLPDLAPGVTIAEGPIAEGWKAAAPYDVILVEGAVECVPDAIASQLRRPGGRLVTVMSRSDGRVGQGVLAEVTTRGHEPVALSFQPVFDCATPLLPPLRARPAFVF